MKLIYFHRKKRKISINAEFARTDEEVSNIMTKLCMI